MTVLITGGAGYVGSHALKQLRESGTRCVVLDNLSRGHRESVLDAELIVGDVADADLVSHILVHHGITAVMHFAAFAYVGESVHEPARYYLNNVAATIRLLDCMVRHDVRTIVFSSTCATYGLPETTPMTEDHPQRPVNPYGASKLMIERVLKDFETAYGLKSVVLRYFNAAGADPSGQIGEWHEPETHLIPLILFNAAGLRESVEVFGTDYPTPDGTCIRDYIHVTDLAQAHELALHYLEARNPSAVFNLGNGSGFSVRAVIETAERVTSRKINAINVARRPGDPHSLVGSAAKAREVLGWAPKYDSLEAIVRTAWNWHRQHSR